MVKKDGLELGAFSCKRYGLTCGKTLLVEFPKCGLSNDDKERFWRLIEKDPNDLFGMRTLFIDTVSHHDIMFVTQAIY